MPEIIKQITPEEVGKFIAQAKNALGMLRAISALTPTAVDDTILLALSRFIEVVEPFAAEPWFTTLLDFALSYIWSIPKLRKIIEPLVESK